MTWGLVQQGGLRYLYICGTCLYGISYRCYRYTLLAVTAQY